MRSLTAGLARQAVVAVAMGALLILGVTASPNSDRRAPIAVNLDKPIQTRAIVIADAAPAPSFQSARAAANVKPAPAAPKSVATTPKPIAMARVHIAATPTPSQRPADLAPQAAPEVERPFDLRKRLFAPVNFVRDSVARLMSWP